MYTVLVIISLSQLIIKQRQHFNIFHEGRFKVLEYTSRWRKVSGSVVCCCFTSSVNNYGHAGTS